jgi:multiple antibiotic resistance protein
VNAVSWRLFGEVFVTLTVIMDPLGTVPIFLGLTAGRPLQARRRLAAQAVLVAGSVIATFAVFGQEILGYLGITLPALQGAGGLLLVLVALELLRGGAGEPEEVPDVNVALVPLGTPLLAGPGAIAATIVFVRQADGGADVVAIALALVAVHAALWLALRYSAGVLRVVGDAGIHLVTRILGLLLTAIAVQLLAESVRAFVEAG